MPSKFRIKNYVSGAYYHIYNRGFDGREIFTDAQDFEKFIDLLKTYVSSPIDKKNSRFKSEKPSVVTKKKLMNLKSEVEIVAYCLMADHFHLVVKQNSINGITKLMRRVNTSYVMYYNSRHKRRGPLFENIYRAIKLEGEGGGLVNTLAYLSVYLHLHPVTRTEHRIGPVVTVYATRPEDYEYTSLSQYIDLNTDNWIENRFILAKTQNYEELMKWPQKQIRKTLEPFIFQEMNTIDIH